LPARGVTLGAVRLDELLAVNDEAAEYGGGPRLLPEPLGRDARVVPGGEIPADHPLVLVAEAAGRALERGLEVHRGRGVVSTGHGHPSAEVVRVSIAGIEGERPGQEGGRLLRLA